MGTNDCDILMITYNRPEYTRLSLSRLLETCDHSARVWLWHNGNHGETLEIVNALAHHPHVHQFHHSIHNVGLREPTNWIWNNSKGAYLAKVDDDCVVPEHWIETLRRCHEDVPHLGIISCWHFRPEDFDEQIAKHKIIDVAGGHRVMVNCWTGGSGYLMKRQCVEQHGPLGPRQTFTDYGIELARKGWINGWYFPFLYQDHMDDPRSEHCRYKTDADFQASPSLSAGTFRIRTLDEFRAAHREGAIALQRASVDPQDYTGWRALLRRLRRRITNRFGHNHEHG